MEYSSPVHAISCHECSSSADGKTGQRVIRIELHVSQDEIEVFTDAAGIVIGRQRDLVVPRKLRLQCVIDGPGMAAVIGPFYVVIVEDVDDTGLIGTCEEAHS